jgi:hypothetical protein
MQMPYLLFFLLTSLLTAAPPGPPVEVVGLKNVALRPGERLWGFDIELAEGRIIAVCAVPDGWKITAENYGEAGLYKNGGGRVQGTADFGHDALSADDMSELDAFLLVGVSRVHGKPATFTGTITTSGPGVDRQITLGAANFVRSAASRCAPRKS